MAAPPYILNFRKLPVYRNMQTPAIIFIANYFQILQKSDQFGDTPS